MLLCLLPVWQYMAKDYLLTVEVHFIPIPSDQAADKLQRLRDLLVRGAHRLVQQTGDCKQQVELVKQPRN
jgi:hypothetical protein